MTDNKNMEDCESGPFFSQEYFSAKKEKFEHLRYNIR